MHNEYANALFSISLENNIQKEIKDNLIATKDIFDEEIIKFINNPKISKNEKIDIISKSFKGANQFYINFLSIIIENNRINDLFTIINDSLSLINESLNITVIDVHSSKELSNEEETKLINSLKKRFNSDIELNNVIDSKHIGSYKLYMNGYVLDDTIKTRLSELKSSIL